jgi:hypothetical protein
MVTFFSKFHGMYVAQYTDEGTLYTGRADTFIGAISACLRSLYEYKGIK